MFKTAVISGLLCSLLAGTGVYLFEDARWSRREALRTAQIQSENAQAISALRAREIAAQGRVDALARQYTQQQQEYSRENSNLLARVRSAEYRLRLPAAVYPAAPAGAPAPASGADAAVSYELSSGATQALFRIAERADSCAITLNALQDYVRGLLLENPNGSLVE